MVKLKDQPPRLSGYSPYPAAAETPSWMAQTDPTNSPPPPPFSLSVSPFPPSCYGQSNKRDPLQAAHRGPAPTRPQPRRPEPADTAGTVSADGKGTLAKPAANGTRDQFRNDGAEAGARLRPRGVKSCRRQAPDVNRRPPRGSGTPRGWRSGSECLSPPRVPRTPEKSNKISSGSCREPRRAGDCPP